MLNIEFVSRLYISLPRLTFILQGGYPFIRDGHYGLAAHTQDQQQRRNGLPTMQVCDIFKNTFTPQSFVPRFNLNFVTLMYNQEGEGFSIWKYIFNPPRLPSTLTSKMKRGLSKLATIHILVFDIYTLL